MGDLPAICEVKCDVMGAQLGALKEQSEVGWVQPMPCNNYTVLLFANLLASDPFPCGTGRIHACPGRMEKMKMKRSRV